MRVHVSIKNSLTSHLTLLQSSPLTREVLGVLVGTRLMNIIRRDDGSWEVWTAVNSCALPYYKWLGTYIHLRPDGSASTVTIRNNEGDDVTDVMEKL